MNNMKKFLAMVFAVIATLCLFAGCDLLPTETPTEAPEDPTKVNLMDLYTVSDPEGVEYDQRVALYAPILEDDESYAAGARDSFSVFYGKDGKGVYMFSITIYETAEQASAYLAEAGMGTVDGTAYITTSDASFFQLMEEFIPDLQTWIDNLQLSGYITLD